MSSPVSRRKFLAASSAGIGMATMTSASILAAEQQKEKLPHRPLGKIGRKISIVGFGGGSRYLLQEDLDEAEKMIHRAVELGITYFDTAYGYRKNGVCESHRRYGRFLTPHYRNQITLTTKLAARDAETAKRQLEEALKDLQTDRVEILHFHAVHSIEDVDRIVAKDGALKVFQRAKQEGVTKYIGVTAHMNPDVLLNALQRIRPDCTMYPHNPVHDAKIYGDWSMAPCGVSFAKVVTPYVIEHGIGRLAMKVTGQNHLVGKQGVAAEDLVRYALSQGMAAAIIGMPNLKVVESNAHIARTAAPMPDAEQASLQNRLAAATSPADLPYLASDYTDGSFLS